MKIYINDLILNAKLKAKEKKKRKVLMLMKRAF